MFSPILFQSIQKTHAQGIKTGAGKRKAVSYDWLIANRHLEISKSTPRNPEEDVKDRGA